MKEKSYKGFRTCAILILFVCSTNAVLSGTVDVLDKNIYRFVNDEKDFIEQVQNARFYSLNDDEFKKWSGNNLSLINKSNCPLLRARLAALSCNNDKSKLVGCITSNSDSPSALTIIESYTPDYFEKRKGLWSAAIRKDHQWLPAIIDSIRVNSGGAVFGHGSSALELTAVNSMMATQAYDLLLQHYSIGAIKPLDDINEILRKVEEQEWPERFIEQKYRLTASLYYHKGNLKKSLELYSLVNGDKFRKESTYYRVSKIHKKLGNNKAAYEELKNGFSKYPNSSILYMCMAELKFEDKAYNEALINVNRSLQIASENPRVYVLKANILSEMNRRHDAMDACINAIQYSYGWGDEILEDVNAVIEALNTAKE